MSMAVYIHIKSSSNLMAFLRVSQPGMLRSTSFDAVEYKSSCCGVQVNVLCSTSRFGSVSLCASL
jgi:hypothetical protein